MGYKTKICLRCGKEFQSTVYHQNVCLECSQKRRIEHPKRIRRTWEQIIAQERFERHKAAAKRRILGYAPINTPFKDCEGHHVTQELVVYIPYSLHRSIPHNIWTGKNMDAINALAYEWLAQNP